jgi:predicted transposase/invertase (TIGR01784 family)
MTYAIERAIDRLERRGKRRGKIEGKIEGIREGEREGIRKGERKGKLEMAMAMLDDGLPLETASKYSGIPADELSRHMAESKTQ